MHFPYATSCTLEVVLIMQMMLLKSMKVNFLGQPLKLTRPKSVIADGNEAEIFTFFYSVNDINQKKMSSTYSDKTTLRINNLFRNSIWRAFFRQAWPLTIQLIILISKSQSERESLVVSEECMFYVPLCGFQLSVEGKRREIMHRRLKIASVGSVIICKIRQWGLHVALRASLSLQ